MVIFTKFYWVRKNTIKDGIPLKWNRGIALDNSFSFDRIDSSKGYTLDNLEVISVKANRAKNNLTEEELKKFGLYYA